MPTFGKFFVTHITLSMGILAGMFVLTHLPILTYGE
jgi:hypothetical protein